MTPKQRKWSRRDFLKLAGAAVVVTASCGGLTALATRAPAIDLPEQTFGENMKQKILVAYASKTGTTAEIATAIGKTLASDSAEVDVMPVQSVTNLEGYRAVVLGSAIRMGQWMPEALKLIEANQTKLKDLPVATFTVHMLNLDNSDESRKTRESYVAPIHALITPKAETYFAGRMDFSKLSFLERLMSKAVKAVEGDLRDWDAIRTWSEGLKATL